QREPSTVSRPKPDGSSRSDRAHHPSPIFPKSRGKSTAASRSASGRAKPPSYSRNLAGIDDEVFTERQQTVASVKSGC
ncbi:MAG TPA: hypothetical protein VGJ56_16550, partial [Reyranella sp.]